MELDRPVASVQRGGRGPNDIVRETPIDDSSRRSWLAITNVPA